MTQQERVSELWKILREDYGIETMEQFWEAYWVNPKFCVNSI